MGEKSILMKNIGRTDDGNFIIELNESEQYTFEMLCRSIEGKPWPEPFERHNGISGHDLTHTFEFIRAWAVTRMRLNELQIHLDALKRDLEEK